MEKQETTRKVSLAQFEEVAAANGYEVFTPEEIAGYYKEGIMKSQAGELTSAEKEAFVADMMYLQKAVVSDTEGKEIARYYRKQQVEWAKTEDGTLLKGVEGTFLDTPENRRLKRVGLPYVPNPDVLKSILLDEDNDICKALKSRKDYEDKEEVRKREEKTKEAEGGVKGDEKLHKESGKKNPEEDEDEVKKREAKLKEREAGIKGDEKLHEDAKK